MSQRNSHCRLTETSRLPTVFGVLRLRSNLIITLVLVLVLLIISGGAG